MEVTQVSSLNGFGTRKVLISPDPFAGTLYGCGNEMMTSGWIRQPFAHSMGAGLSFVSPSGAPLSAHDVSVFISFSDRRGSLRKSPYSGSANQGGMFLLTVASLIAFAQGRVLSYVRNDIGATSPGRW